MTRIGFIITFVLMVGMLIGVLNLDWWQILMPLGVGFVFDVLHFVVWLMIGLWMARDDD